MAIDPTTQQQITQSPFIPPGLPSGLAGLIGQPDQPAQQSTPPLSQTSPTAPPAAPPSAGGAPPQQSMSNPGAGLDQYGQLAQQQIGQYRQSPDVIAARQASAGAVQKAREYADPSGMPKFGPRIEPGKGKLHNIGQGVLMGLGATGPGQAVEQQIYGPEIRRYKESQAGKAKEIEALQAQATGEEKLAGGEAQIAGRTIMGAGQVEKGAMSLQGHLAAIGQAAHATALKYQADMAKIAATKDIAQQRNETNIKMRQMTDETLDQIAAANNTNRAQVEGMRGTVEQNVKDAMIAANPSVFGWLKEQVFGMPAVQTAGGQGAVAKPVPAQPAPTPGKGAPANPAKTSPQRPSNVPSDYIYKKGPKGEGWYRP